MTSGEAAAWYARRFGWHVIPIRAKSKIPLIEQWQIIASIDLGTIRTWWSQWPDAGVGILTGAPSELVVLDVDGDLGENSLHRLTAQHGLLPDTVEALSGGGGRHILFQHPGHTVRNSAGKLGPGLDIRGDAGFIVGWPSIHPNGCSYEWEVSRVPLARAPEWLIRPMSEPHAKRTDEVWRIGMGNSRYMPSEILGISMANAAVYGRCKRQGRYRRELLPDPADYYARHLHALRFHGDWGSARCPFHDDKNPSLSVNRVHGGFFCHGCGAKGGDVLAFHQRLNNLDFVAAAADLGAWGAER